MVFQQKSDQRTTKGPFFFCLTLSSKSWLSGCVLFRVVLGKTLEPFLRCVELPLRRFTPVFSERFRWHHRNLMKKDSEGMGLNYLVATQIFFFKINFHPETFIGLLRGGVP